MPKNVGKYDQGGIVTHPDAPMPSAGVPSKTPLAPAAPKNPQWEPDPMHAAPNNDAHKV